MGLGDQIITAQNDQDFNTDIGNWVKVGTDTGTCTFSSASIGGADDKQALLTAVGDGTLGAYLPTGDCPISASTTVVVSANILVPVGNTLKDIAVGPAGDLAGATGNELVTLIGDLWTRVAATVILGVDVTGNLQIAFNGNPAASDLLYFDDVSVLLVKVPPLVGGGSKTLGTELK